VSGVGQLTGFSVQVSGVGKQMTGDRSQIRHFSLQFLLSVFYRLASVFRSACSEKPDT